MTTPAQISNVSSANALVFQRSPSAVHIVPTPTNVILHQNENASSSRRLTNHHQGAGDGQGSQRPPQRRTEPRRIGDV